MYVLRYSFIPINPFLATMNFSFFCFFVISKSCASLLSHNASKSNFCVKLLSCKRNFVSQNFLGPLLQKSPNMGPPKLIFLIAQAGAIVFVFVSRYLSKKCFDIAWGHHPPRGPLMDPPKIHFLNGPS